MYGVISIIPVSIIIILALITKRALEPMFAGVVVAFLILCKGNPIDAFYMMIDKSYIVFAKEGTIWLILTTIAVGGLLVVIEKSKGLEGFTKLLMKYLKTKKQALLGTWVLGVLICISEYMNAIAVGAAMKGLTDKYKSSREMLAYIINATGVSVVAIVPFSAWAAFMGAQMHSGGMILGDTIMGTYLQAIPFVVYGWLAVLSALLVILGVIPLYGPMKDAEIRAQNGIVYPGLEPEEQNESVELEGKERTINFLLPLGVVAFLAVYNGDILVALLGGLIVCFIMYLAQRLMTITQFTGYIIKGAEDMVSIIFVIILAYILVEANNELGLIDFVISNTLGVLNPSILPMLIFVVIGSLAFASGTFWSLAALTFPIVGPLAAGIGANMALCAGALISGVAFGGHICLYSDTVLMACASTKVSNGDFFKTSAPLVAIPAVLSIVIFLILGFIL